MARMSRIPDTTGAVCVQAPGKHEYIQLNVPTPEPREVLVEVAAAGICGSDAELLAGDRPEDYVSYPIVPGHEWSGTIVTVGDAVTRLHPGQRVVGENIRPCGVCDRCREGRTNLCEAGYEETGFTKPGGFAGYLAVPEQLIHVLPDDADLAAAALIEPTSIVTASLLACPPRTGSTVIILGAGTLGLITVQLCALYHPNRLIAVDHREDRLGLATRFGATETRCLGADGAYPDDLLGIADVAYEAAGNPAAVVSALRATRRGGTTVLAGVAGSDAPAIPPDLFAVNNLDVHGIFGASSTAWQHAVRLYSNGTVDLGPLISHRFALPDYAEAFGLLAGQQPGVHKILLTPTPSDGMS